MTDRKLYWESDTLLDKQQHPPGTRLILSMKSTNPIDPYEVVVGEWAPSGRRVKLRHEDGNSRWVECWDYTPVVIEVLPEPFQPVGISR